MKHVSKTAMLFIFASVTCFAFASYVKYGHKLSTSKNVVVATVPTAPIKVQPTPIYLSKGPAAPMTPVELEIIEFTDENMVAMDQAFDDESVTTVMRDLQKLSDKAPKGATIYLVLNTPGGSVPAGQRLISFAKALPVKVKTVTLFAASMGFQTVQNLDERLILDSGTLMSHRARFGVQGEVGQIQSRLKYFMSIINSLDAVAAQRMGMSVEAYQKMIHDEYWVFGQDAVTEKAADRMVYAKCGKGLNKTKISKVSTLFGMVNVEMSSCPLMPGILSVSADASVDDKTMEYVRMMFTDRNGFVNKYITTNKFKEFVVDKE